jgi:1,2-diacylglycerol 3-beta-galactosyltransferase
MERGNGWGQKRIVFVFFDAGGGHRIVTEAVAAALLHRAVGEIEVAKVEFFEETGLKGLGSITKDLYNHFLIEHPFLYRLYYEMGNFRLIIGLLHRLLLDNRFWSGIEQIIDDKRGDLCILVNPYLCECFYRVNSKRQKRTPLINLVSDPFSIHSLWLSPHADINILFSEEAKEVFLKSGIEPSRIRVFPYPVHPKFELESLNRDEILNGLGFDHEYLTLLIHGSGYKRDVYAKTVLRIIDRALPVQMIVVCGKDKELYEALKSQKGKTPYPMKVCGFVDTMHELLAASDLLICKAGPAMIFEAIIMRRPMVITDFIPGQEKGNCRFVLQNDFGWHLRTPEDIVRLVERILDDRDILTEKKRKLEASGISNGSRDVADYLIDLIQNSGL